MTAALEISAYWSAVRYVINNPVRAGLAASPGDYPFWGSQMYVREEMVEFVGRGPRAELPFTDVMVL